MSGNFFRLVLAIPKLVKESIQIEFGKVPRQGARYTEEVLRFLGAVYDLECEHCCFTSLAF